MATNQTATREENTTSCPFEAGTYGFRYFASLAGMSADNLRRRQAQLDQQLTYTMDDECRRMVALQCVHTHLEARS